MAPLIGLAVDSFTGVLPRDQACSGRGCDHYASAHYAALILKSLVCGWIGSVDSFMRLQTIETSRPGPGRSSAPCRLTHGLQPRGPVAHILDGSGGLRPEDALRNLPYRASWHLWPRDGADVDDTFFPLWGMRLRPASLFRFVSSNRDFFPTQAASPKADGLDDAVADGQIPAGSCLRPLGLLMAQAAISRK